MALVIKLLLGSGSLVGLGAAAWYYVLLMGNVYLHTRGSAWLRVLSLAVYLLLLPITLVLALPIMAIYWAFGYGGDHSDEWAGAEDFRRVLEAMADYLDNPLATSQSSPVISSG